MKYAKIIQYSGSSHNGWHDEGNWSKMAAPINELFGIIVYEDDTKITIAQCVSNYKQAQNLNCVSKKCCEIYRFIEVPNELGNGTIGRFVLDNDKPEEQN